MARKGIYIWQPTRIGTPDEVANELEKAKVQVVAIKAHNGTYMYEIQDYVDAIRAKGIEVGIWAYIYLKYNALGEAYTAIKAVRKYKPAFYLIDAEAEAVLQFVPALTFAKTLRLGVGSLPIGLNSYWKPSYHPNLPWKQLRSVCNFDCPQVYRYGMPSALKLATSKAEYAALSPKLPMSKVAGDMYLDRGWKPTPDLLQQFIDAVNADPEFKDYIMWSMDQKDVVPELWAQFAGYEPVPPAEVHPIYTAVVTARRGLFIRNAPNGLKVGGLVYGAPVYVYKETIGWASINKDNTEWVSTTYLKKLEAPGSPLYSAKVNTIYGLNVRDAPGGRKLRAIPYNYSVDAWAEKNGWTAINQQESEWVSSHYLTRT